MAGSALPARAAMVAHSGHGRFRYHRRAPGSRHDPHLTALLRSVGQMSSNESGEGEIRKAIIEANLVDRMIALPGRLFCSTQIPACLWFVARDGSGRPQGSPLRHPRPVGAPLVGAVAPRARNTGEDESRATTRLAPTMGTHDGRHPAHCGAAGARLDRERHHRRSIRLRGFDYSQASAYFVTICTQDRACVFGAIQGQEMRLNDAGRMVAKCWETLPARFPVMIDHFVVMPNHFHGILWIVPAVGAPLVGARRNDPPTGGTGLVATQAADPPTVGAPLVGARRNDPPTGATGLVPTQAADPPTVGAPLVGALAPRARNTGEDESGATTRLAPALGAIIGAFKSLTTIEYGRCVKTAGWRPFPGRLWQRNYHDHIIRNEEPLNRIRQYILDNPAQWEFDRENPAAAEPKAEDAWAQ